MIQLGICSFLIGAVFGLRFKVTALAGLSMFGAINIVLIGLLVGKPTSELLLNALGFVVALQGGYLFGSFVRFAMAGMRATRAVPARSPLNISR